MIRLLLLQMGPDAPYPLLREYSRLAEDDMLVDILYPERVSFLGQFKTSLWPRLLAFTTFVCCSAQSWILCAPPSVSHADEH